MTKRLRDRAARVSQAAGAGLRREAFPALTAFAKGYLHEDFPEVHGSARDAAAAFSSVQKASAAINLRSDGSCFHSCDGRGVSASAMQTVTLT